jgi:hypothetical protein
MRKPLATITASIAALIAVAVPTTVALPITAASAHGVPQGRLVR